MLKNKIEWNVYLAIPLLLIGMCFPTLLKAQTIDEIKNDKTYLWGHGKGVSISRADRMAMKDLTEQITSTVESKFELIIREDEEGEVEQTLEGIIKTYSSSTLTNTKRIVVEDPDNGGVEVLRYMKKEDVNKIFNKRKIRIKGYISSAIMAEEEGRIGDALRYYYWAQTLLNSHPDNQELMYTYKGIDQLMFSWLPDRINRLFTLVTIEPKKIKKKGENEEIIFNVFYKGNKAYNIDYSYWTGSDWSTIVGASNGQGIIELFGESECAMEQIRVKIEYEYVNKCRMDPELPSVIEVAQLPYYRKAVKMIDKTALTDDKPAVVEEKPAVSFASGSFAQVATTESQAVYTNTSPQVAAPKTETQAVETHQEEPVVTEAEPEATEPETEPETIEEPIVEEPVASEPEIQKLSESESSGVLRMDMQAGIDSVDSKKISEKVKEAVAAAPLPICENEQLLLSKINLLLESIQNKEYANADSVFNDDGREIYHKIVAYGNAKQISPALDLNITCLGQEAIVRAIPFVFDFPNNNRKFIENLTFTFDTTGLITNIGFSLNELSLEGILSHSKWSDASKWHIIDFLENYKTAYALERLDYIDKIFADNALIIVGKRLEKAEPIDGMYKSLRNDQFEFVKVSKKEYIERLGIVFSNNEFVNIQFEECQVKKRDRNSEVYGIQIAQNYFSTGYADKGYLFLMVDLNNEKQPKIYVRSWQPEKNPDGSIIGLGSFFN